MITKYPDSSDVKVMILDKMHFKDARDYFKKRGIFLITNNNTAIADFGCRFLLGHNDYEEMRVKTFDLHNFKKMSTIKLKSSKEFLSLKDDFMTKNGVVIDPKSGLIYHVNYVARDKDNEKDKDKLVFSVEYKAKKGGNIELLRDDERTFDFIIESNEDGNLVTINHEKSGDYNKVLEVFDAVSKGVTENTTDSIPFIINKITLDNLSLPEKIELFDKLLNYKFEKCELRCKLENVVEIKIRKNKKTDLPQEMNDESESEELEEDLPDQDLRDINEALIKGDNLRTNALVNRLIKNKYYFYMVAIKLAHIKDPINVTIRITFNSNPEFLEVKVINSAEIVNEEESSLILSPTEQNQYIKKITEVLWEIYNSFNTGKNATDVNFKEDKIIKTPRKRGKKSQIIDTKNEPLKQM